MEILNMIFVAGDINLLKKGKNVMKKTMAILLTLIMLVSVFPVSSSAFSVDSETSLPIPTEAPKYIISRMMPEMTEIGYLQTISIPKKL